MSEPPTAPFIQGFPEEADPVRESKLTNERNEADQNSVSRENVEQTSNAEVEVKKANTSPLDAIDHEVASKHNSAQQPQEAAIAQISTPDPPVIPNNESTTGFTTVRGHSNELANPAGLVNQQTAMTLGATLSIVAESSHVNENGDAASAGFDEPPRHEGATNLEIDSDETDSAIGDMTPISSTASLRSSIYEAIQENGRTYHRYKEGKYLLPNDEVEQERLDLQHHLCLLSLDGKLHLAPTGTDLSHVLDIGTGTGIWAIEFALQHSSTTVIGSDLSPIQPNFVPVNCRFEVDDAEDVWAYSHKFDFVHGRMLFSCFKDPAGVIASSFKALERGRYFEMMDVNFPFKSVDDSLKGTALEKWCSLLIAGAKELGKDWTCTSKYPRYFEDAGFVDIQVVNYYWPSNAWAKSEHQKILGRWLQQNLLDGVSAMSMAALTRGLKMSPAEVELFLVDVRNDIQDRHIHAYCPVDVVYGRKPE